VSSASKILIVEDEAIIAEEIRGRLQNLGYEVTDSLRKGEAVLQSVEDNPPDLVLMDIVLRGKMDGVQATCAIKAHHNIPVVYLTAYADTQTIQRAKSSGASGYLIKPIREKELYATIELALEKQARPPKPPGNEVFFRKMFDASASAMFLIDPEANRYIEVNLKSCEMLGFSRKELLAQSVSDVHVPVCFEEEYLSPSDEDHGEGKKSLEALFQDAGRKGFSWSNRLASRKKTGASLSGDFFAYTIDLNHRPCIVVLQSHLSNLKSRKEDSALAETFFNVAAEAILVTDADKNILSVNPAFLKITGYSREEVIGKNPSILSSGRHERGFYDEMWAEIETSGHWEGEIWNRKKNGTIYPEWLSVVSVKNAKGEVVYYTGLFSDITKRKLYEERLHFQAYYDLLTRLPNRMLIYERLSQAIIESRRSKEKIALLNLDLNRFKAINDARGHLFGDKILKLVAVRLLSCVRESDTVARSGGDEFLMVLHAGRDETLVVVKKIIQKLSEPFHVDGRSVSLGASIGITIIPEDGVDVSKLLKNADMAMYKAKNNKEVNFHFFSESMDEASRERLEMESEIKAALLNHDFLLHYQPVISLKTLKPLSLEALIRWKHPRKGLLFPDQFIPFAEESGLIGKIDTWMIATACRQIKSWQTRYNFQPHLSVNLSKRLLEYEDFYASISSALEESQLAPECLMLEVNEGLLTSRSRELMSRLSSLKALGVQIAVDDFGSSYSSLEALSQLPVDALKIDRSFVAHPDSEPRKKSLFEALVHVGKSMEMEVVAKGIEHQNDLAYLSELHCDAAQGHYFSKAVSSEVYEAAQLNLRKL